MKELQKKIRNLKEKKLLGRFYVSVDDVERNFDGFILEESKSFILLRECADFEVNGFVIIEKNKIQTIRYSKYEITFTKIIKKEKIIDRVFICDKTDLSSYSSFLKEIKKKHKYAIVESAYNGKLDFCIGEIVKVNKESVSIRYFDATGKMEEVYKIPYKEVIDIEFDSDYINIFKKYLRK